MRDIMNLWAMNNLTLPWIWICCPITSRPSKKKSNLPYKTRGLFMMKEVEQVQEEEILTIEEEKEPI